MNAPHGPDVIWTNLHVACALWLNCSDVTHRSGGYQLLICCFITNYASFGFLDLNSFERCIKQEEKEQEKQNVVSPKSFGRSNTFAASVYLKVRLQNVQILLLTCEWPYRTKSSPDFRWKPISWIGFPSCLTWLLLNTVHQQNVRLYYTTRFSFSWGDSAYRAIVDFFHTRISSNLGISMKDLDFESSLT